MRRSTHAACRAVVLSAFLAMGCLAAPGDATAAERLASQLNVWSDGSARLAVSAMEPCSGSGCERIALNCDDTGSVTITVYALPAPDAGLWLATREGAALEGMPAAVRFRVVSFSAIDDERTWTAWLRPQDPTERPRWLTQLSDAPTLKLVTAIGDIGLPVAGHDRENIAGFVTACLGDQAAAGP